eukprot:m.23674 g.23674  ORF g.23674 m.23674 type:complete len:156 (+) comp14307_c0_seq1:159-626(+)
MRIYATIMDKKYKFQRQVTIGCNYIYNANSYWQYQIETEHRTKWICFDLDVQILIYNRLKFDQDRALLISNGGHKMRLIFNHTKNQHFEHNEGTGEDRRIRRRKDVLVETWKAFVDKLEKNDLHKVTKLNLANDKSKDINKRKVSNDKDLANLAR